MAGENALRNSVHEIGTFVVFLDYVLEKLRCNDCELLVHDDTFPYSIINI